MRKVIVAAIAALTLSLPIAAPAEQPPTCISALDIAADAIAQGVQVIGLDKEQDAAFREAFKEGSGREVPAEVAMLMAPNPDNAPADAGGANIIGVADNGCVIVYMTVPLELLREILDMPEGDPA